MHELRTYPPRVKISIHRIAPEFVIFVKIDGCTEDVDLDTELMFTKEGDNIYYHRVRIYSNILL